VFLAGNINIAVQAMSRFQLKLKIIKTIIRIFLAWAFFLYPGILCINLFFDNSLKQGAVSEFTIKHFQQVSLRFQRWATHYIQSEHSTKVDFENCAATEWPMFGSVYYLLTAEEIHRLLANRNDPLAKKTKKALLESVRTAAQIVADPKTGAWVKQKWGPTYRSRENVFYRMLLIMGLSSYENITGDKTYRSLLEEQSTSLASELMNAPYHVLDDYPGECYPNDVLWAVAAIDRANRLIGGIDTALLKSKLAQILNTRSLTKESVPAYRIDSRTGLPVSPARGCANSGILVFAPEVDLKIATKWYAHHERYFWKSKSLCMGFREYTRDYQHAREDVDTGPIIAEYGSVASLFGIGAARALGRIDHSIPLTMEMIALSWPTPFGFIFPSILAYGGSGASCLGEVTLIFLMTRPILTQMITPFTGTTPAIAWLACVFYLCIGIVALLQEFLCWRKYFRGNRNHSSQNKMNSKRMIA
jgi:hypothetical protein